MKLLFFVVVLVLIFACFHESLAIRRNRTIHHPAVRQRVVHPRFRPGVRAERRRITTTAKPMRLLARNHPAPAVVDELDAHYHQQIRSFFEHQHPAVQTRPRVKTGLK